MKPAPQVLHVNTRESCTRRLGALVRSSGTMRFDQRFWGYRRMTRVQRQSHVLHAASGAASLFTSHSRCQPRQLAEPRTGIVATYGNERIPLLNRFNSVARESSLSYLRRASRR